MKTATAFQSVESIQVATPDVYNTCVALLVHFSQFGNRRTVELDEPVEGTAPEYLNTTKQLITNDALREIRRLTTRTKDRLLESAAVPSFASDGMYLVSVAGVERAEEILSEEEAELGKLVDKLIARYGDPAKTEKSDPPTLIDIAREKLGPLFNIADYPTVEALRAKFGMSWRYLSLGAPAQLQAVSGKFMREQREKVAAASRDAASEIRAMYRASLLDLSTHLADMLTPGADGKKRRFYDSALEKINAFIDADSIRNVTNDADVRAITIQIRGILAGMNADDIRDNDRLRARLAANMNDVVAKLEPLVRTGRAIAIE